jgi:hypothetical protein
MKREWVLPSVVGVCVFLLALAGTFLAWAEADGIHAAPTWNKVFVVLSFPVSAIAFDARYFWTYLTLNSALWGVVMAIGTLIFRKKVTSGAKARLVERR